ncbi:peptide-methionine (R)-S-oxide reductase MsrB [Sphingomonas abietis]|uniref:peptide-methionine (R)-S-oxide reductase n=1 Tax=Sphingomonas abietis TaxID=3012344 RepID=A0ABY7NPH7_9SPHN|nr:peptide-methionine (R)-S-oxide reductase MsrB [Sphingomonas abietis]WBO23283.1 peptide-methionine (R)-S-oxide reductase MsrB [Sphingomonas abietis]
MTHFASPDRRTLLGLGASAAVAAVAWRWLGQGDAAAIAATPAAFKLSDAEWRKRLSPQAYKVLREASTEFPYTSPLNAEHRKGVFACAGCALPLFASATKFDSGTGWPSFYDHLPKAIAERSDTSLGEERIEVHCARCAGHLGHVFDDGPKPTGLRYCMNGVAMTFMPTA